MTTFGSTRCGRHFSVGVTRHNRFIPAIGWVGLVFSIGALLAPLAVFAHSGGDAVGGLMSGFAHPFYGLDHVTAMVAVGILGALMGQPAIWLLPVVFPMVMALGGALGVLGIPLPGIEPGIAISSIVLGGIIAVAIRPPLWLAAIIVAVFAIFHGYAHGVELPAAASPLTYCAGFVIATGLLHLFGIAIGELIRWPWGRVVSRVVGALIAVAGLVFLGRLW